MLNLDRRFNESIIIGDNIKITILGGNKGQQVRIGIEAPKDIAVHREEVYRKLKHQNDKSQDS